MILYFFLYSIDTEPPTWTVCPTEASATSPNGVDSVSVSWPQPLAEDNSNNVTVSAGTHGIGDSFPVGKTPVSYTATDAAGHMIACTFTVTVPGKSITKCQN